VDIAEDPLFVEIPFVYAATEVRSTALDSISYIASVATILPQSC